MRSFIIKARVTPQEYEAYVAEANRQNVPLSEWMRDACDEAVRRAYAKTLTVATFTPAAIEEVLRLLKNRDGA